MVILRLGGSGDREGACSGLHGDRLRSSIDRGYIAARAALLPVRQFRFGDFAEIGGGPHHQSRSRNLLVAFGAAVVSHHAVTCLQFPNRHFGGLGRVGHSGCEVQNGGLVGGGDVDAVTLVGFQDKLVACRSDAANRARDRRLRRRLGYSRLNRMLYTEQCES